MTDELNTHWTLGYASGVEWHANWMPGGPFVMHSDTEIGRASRVAHAEWMRGFNDGLAERLKDAPEFAAWFERNKGKLPHEIYHNRLTA